MYDYRATNYNTPVQYIVNHIITEFDITKADISILYTKGVLSEQEYNVLRQCSKEERNISVGYLLKEKEKATLYSNALAEYRKRFIEVNHISDEQIVSVHKDSFFLQDCIPSITVFDHNVQFLQKKQYILFIQVPGLQFFYNIDRMSNIESIEVKGINDIKLERHTNGMIQLLCELFDILLSETVSDAISYLKQQHIQYLNRNLPIDYYREFNADSMYRIRINQITNYQLECVSEDNKRYLDISYNDYIIRNLYSILSSIYFANNRSSRR